MEAPGAVCPSHRAAALGTFGGYLDTLVSVRCERIGNAAALGTFGGYLDSAAGASGARSAAAERSRRDASGR